MRRSCGLLVSRHRSVVRGELLRWRRFYSIPCGPVSAIVVVVTDAGEPSGGPPTEPSVAARLQGNLGTLPGAERRVARALLADYPSAGLGTLNSLAAAAGVSAATVSRFVRSMGWESFAFLQHVLREEVRYFTAGPLSRVSEQQEAGTAVAHLVSRAERLSEIVNASLRTVPNSDFEAAISLLCDPKRHIVLGGGRYSRVLAEYLHLHLEQFRPHVRFLDQPVGRDLGRLLDLDRRDVYVLYDFKRYDDMTHRIAQLARSSKASVVLVTDEGLSPAAKYADVVLPISIDSPSPFDSWVAPLTLTEMLLLEVFERLEVPARRRMVRWEAIRRLPLHGAEEGLDQQR